MFLNKQNYSVTTTFISLLIIGVLSFGCSDQSSVKEANNPAVMADSVQPEIVESTVIPTIPPTEAVEPEKEQNVAVPTPVVMIAVKTEPKEIQKVVPTATPVPQPTVQAYITRLVSKVNHVFSAGNIPESDWFRGAKQEALVNPAFVSANAAGSYFGPNDLVIGINHNGVQKAYPTKYMEVYEVINDRFGDEAILVTY